MDERALTAEGRAVVYDWLSGLFAEAQPISRVASYQNGAGADLLAALADAPALRDSINTMRAALPADIPAEQVSRPLERTFAELFLGAGGPNSLPPYESAHVSQSGLLFQEPTGEMQDLLRRLGMSVDAKCKEPPDHLAIELATLAHLLRLEAEGGSGAPDGAAASLVGRLTAWVPAFSERCAALDPTGFYAGASTALVALLDDEHGRSNDINGL